MTAFILISSFVDSFTLATRAAEITQYSPTGNIIAVSEKSEQKDQIEWEVSINQNGTTLDSNLVSLKINDSHQILLNDLKETLHQNNITLESISSDYTEIKLRLPDKEEKYTLLFHTAKQPDVKANYDLHAYLTHQNMKYEAEDRVYFREDIEGNLIYRNTPANMEVPPARVYLINQNTGKVTAEQSLTKDDETYTFESVYAYDDENRKIPYAIIVDPIINYETQIDGFDITYTYRTMEISGNIYNTTNQAITLNVVNTETNAIVSTQEIRADQDIYTVNGLPKQNANGEEIDYIIEVEQTNGTSVEIDGFDITVTEADILLEEEHSVKEQRIDISGRIDNRADYTFTLNIVDKEKNAIVATQKINPKEDMYTVEDLQKKNSDGKDIAYSVEVEAVEGASVEVSGFDIIISANETEKTDLQNAESTSSEREGEKKGEFEGSTSYSKEQTTFSPSRQYRSLGAQSQLNEYIFTKSGNISYSELFWANSVIGTINGQMNSDQTEIVWTLNFSFGGILNPTVQLSDFRLTDGLQVTRVSYNGTAQTTLGTINLGNVKDPKTVTITTEITNSNAPVHRLDVGNVSVNNNKAESPFWAQFQMKSKTPTINTVTNLSDKVEGLTEPNATIIIRNSAGAEIGRTKAAADGKFSATIPRQVVDTVIIVTAQAPQKSISNAQFVNVSYDPATPLKDVVVEDFYDIETGIRGTSDEGTIVTIRDKDGKVLGSSKTIMTDNGPKFYVELYQTFPTNTELIAVAHSLDGKVSNETRFTVKPTVNGVLPPNVLDERQNPYPTYNGEQGIRNMEWDERENYRNRAPQPVEYSEAFLWKYANPSVADNAYEVNLKTQGRSDINSAPLDIVFVIDNSGSMGDSRWFGQSRWDSMEEVLYPFIQDMTMTGKDTRFAVVNYATDIISQIGFSSDYNTIVSNIPNGPQNPVLGSSGTFTQLGLRTGAQYMATARPEAEKVMILLTDGAPTYSYKGTAATGPENITRFSNELLGGGRSFNLFQFSEFLFDNYSIDGIDIRNHGQATISEAKLLKNRFPEMKVFGVGLDLDLDTHFSSTQERTHVLEQVASHPSYAFNTSNILDPDQGLKSILDTITTRVSKSVSRGNVTDPIGDMFDLDLGADDIFNSEDYELTASHPELLKNVEATYNADTRTISLSDLTLGAGEWVNIKYKVQLRTYDSEFEDNKWYPMNGITSLTPTLNAEEIREYPVPEAKAESPVYNFEFIKTDETGHPLQSATFTLSNQKSTFEATSNAQGVVMFSNLKAGNYRMRETIAPDGYLMEETIYNVSIDPHGAITVDDTLYDLQNPFKVINHSIPKIGSITLIKHDASDENKTLSGATFQLKNEEGSILREETTGEDGRIIFDEVPFGEYVLVEKKSPNGYQLDKTPITITVGEDSLNQKIKVANHQTTLPNTGGIGTVWFTVLGLLLISLAFIYRKFGGY